ncbi:MAG: transposase [Elusimicrobiota bacterium]
MPRKARVEYRGGLFHIINRGNAGMEICRDESDFDRFTDYLSVTQEGYPFVCYAYAILPDHFHLLLERLDDPLSGLMKSLLRRYALYFNRKYCRKGHIFNGRYYSVLCQKEEYLLKLIRYIHFSPVRAGLCLKPGEWRWSSQGVYKGRENPMNIDKTAPLKILGGSRISAAVRFEKFMSEDCRKNSDIELNPSEGLPFLGSREFIKDAIEKTIEKRRKSKHDKMISLETLSSIICSIYNADLSLLAVKGGDRNVSKARAMISYSACKHFDYRVSDVARYLKKDPSAVTHSIMKTKKNGGLKEAEEIKKILEDRKLLLL